MCSDDGEANGGRDVTCHEKSENSGVTCKRSTLQRVTETGNKLSLQRVTETGNKLSLQRVTETGNKYLR